MKLFLFSVCFLIASVLVSSAAGDASYFKLIDSLEVGDRASEVFIVDADDGFAYAICLGYDQNNNGVEDQGDTRPSLWKIEYGMNLGTSRTVTKLADFMFNSLIVPVRYDKRKVADKSYLLLPFINNVVCEIDLATGEIVRNYHIDGAAVDAKYDGDNFRVCVLDEQDSPGKILKYNLATGSKIDALSGGVNLQESIMLDGGVIGSLSLGIAGTDDSNLWLRRVSESNVVADSLSIHLGINGNFLYKDKSNQLYATVYGSHKVIKIDLIDPFDHSVIDTLQTGTTGLDGPRQIYTFPTAAFVTTYSGELIIYKNESDTPDQIVEVPGKLEGICGKPQDAEHQVGLLDFIFVASPYKAGFEPNNMIYFIQRHFASVYEPLTSANFKLYPIPAYESINLVFNNYEIGATVEIRDLFGRSMKTINNVSVSSNINVSDLASGSYFAIVSAEGKMWCAPFTVVR